MNTKLIKLISFLNGISLWKRIWISISILFFIWIEIYILINFENDTIITDTLVKAPIISVVFTTLLFIVCFIINWIFIGFKNVEFGDFSKFTIKVMIVTLFFIIIYYVASPYQNCLRNKKGSEQFVINYCTSNTSW